MARYGLLAWAQTIKNLDERRQLATLAGPFKRSCPALSPASPMRLEFGSRPAQPQFLQMPPALERNNRGPRPGPFDPEPLWRVQKGCGRFASDCPAPGNDWHIINGDVCTWDSGLCDLGSNKFRVLDGAMSILPGGQIRSGGCYIALNQKLYIDQNGGLYCEQ